MSLGQRGSQHRHQEAFRTSVFIRIGKRKPSGGEFSICVFKVSRIEFPSFVRGARWSAGDGPAGAERPLTEHPSASPDEVRPSMPISVPLVHGRGRLAR